MGSFSKVRSRWQEVSLEHPLRGRMPSRRLSPNAKPCFAVVRGAPNCVPNSVFVASCARQQGLAKVSRPVQRVWLAVESLGAVVRMIGEVKPEIDMPVGVSFAVLGALGSSHCCGPRAQFKLQAVAVDKEQGA